MNVIELYPRVFIENKKQTVYFSLDSEGAVEIKIQPMEVYYIPHSIPPRLMEENRYPYISAERVGNCLYSVEYEFPVGGRYSVRIREGEEIFFSGYLYAIDTELATLRPFKGETHCHSKSSDGALPAIELMTSYLAAGFDFAALTDHHRFAPSVNVKEDMASLSNIHAVLIRHIAIT